MVTVALLELAVAAFESTSTLPIHLKSFRMVFVPAVPLCS
jgi:hypothetical protein